MTVVPSHHQHGAEVRAVGKVDVGAVERRLFKDDARRRGGELCPAAAQDIQNGGVALQCLLGKAGQGHPAGHGPQHRRERGLTVIPLHGVITGVVFLPAGDLQRRFVQPAALHAEGGLDRAFHGQAGRRLLKPQPLGPVKFFIH